MTRWIFALALAGCQAAAPTLPAPIVVAADDAPLPGVVPDDATYVVYQKTSIIADDEWVYWSAVVMYLVPGEISDFHCNTYHSWIKRAPRAGGGATEILAEVDDYVGGLARGSRGLFWSQATPYCPGPTLVTLDLQGGAPQSAAVSADFMPYPFTALFDIPAGIIGVGTDPHLETDALYIIDPTGAVAPIKSATLDADAQSSVVLTPNYVLARSNESNAIQIISRASFLVFTLGGFRAFGGMTAAGESVYWADNDYPGLPAQIFGEPLSAGPIALIADLPGAQVVGLSSDTDAVWAKLLRGTDTSLLEVPLAGGDSTEYALPSLGGFTDIGDGFLMTDGARILIQPKPLAAR